MTGRGRSVLIYLLAFLCGAVVMSFEVLGIRVIAPDFGSAIFVWGAMISVVLCGLSLGYFGGGVMADRAPRFGGLALMLVVPAVMIGTFRFYAWDVSNWFFDQGFSAERGSLAASMALFLLPTVFLGAVAPYTVRLLVSDPERIGRGAGSLYAVSTMGSIVGTLGTSFFLIGVMGIRDAMQMLGFLLLVLAIVSAWQGEVEARRSVAGAGAEKGGR
jgi:hypothetical protein